jgi:hypothetical protein
MSNDAYKIKRKTFGKSASPIGVLEYAFPHLFSIGLI